MIQTKKKFGIFSVANIVYDDDLFLRLVKDNSYSYITLISHNDFDVPEDVSKKCKSTIVISLEQDSEDIFADFSSTTRNEVRKTLKMKKFGIKFDVPITGKIFGMYKRFRRSKDLYERNVRFLASAKNVAVYFDKEPVVVVTYYDVRPHLRIQNIFSNTEFETEEKKKYIGYATRRAIYEIACRGTEYGYKDFDLAGINLKDPKKKGITQFKESFGGEYATECIYIHRSSWIRVLSLWKKKLWK